MNPAERKKLALSIDNFKSLYIDWITIEMACVGICYESAYPNNIKKLAFEFLREIEPDVGWRQDPDTLKVYPQDIEYFELFKLMLGLGEAG